VTAFARINELAAHAGQPATVRGWVTHLRSSGKVAFIVLRDGTGALQCVLVKSAVTPEVWERFATLTQETCVSVTGEVKPDARAPGGYELGLSDLTIIGPSPLDYPIQPKEHGIDFLLDHRHFWLRSPRQVSIMRIRNEVEMAIHDFFYMRGFLRVDTPILTAAIGERSGLFATEYFDEGNAYLAQTGQLYGEAAAAAFGKIYTFGPTFRAEKSKTRRHLTEFWMIEPEVAFADTHDNMRLQEDFVSFLVQRVVERRGADLGELERDVSKLERIKPPFPRIDYTDAVATLQGKGSTVQWGDDLGAEDESLLVADYDTPIFVMNYPKEIGRAHV
jgi:asparaginyl-tRNA synthetase